VSKERERAIDWRVAYNETDRDSDAVGECVGKVGVSG
jgi:hypothetical protein